MRFFIHHVFLSAPRSSISFSSGFGASHSWRSESREVSQVEGTVLREMQNPDFEFPRADAEIAFDYIVRPPQQFETASSDQFISLVVCKRRDMARAAAMCLVLSWARLGIGMRLFESHRESGGLAGTKKNPMHGVTGVTPSVLRSLTTKKMEKVLARAF